MITYLPYNTIILGDFIDEMDWVNYRKKVTKTKKQKSKSAAIKADQRYPNFMLNWSPCRFSRIRRGITIEKGHIERKSRMKRCCNLLKGRMHEI